MIPIINHNLLKQSHIFFVAHLGMYVANVLSSWFMPSYQMKNIHLI